MSERTIDQIHDDLLHAISKVERSGATSSVLEAVEADFKSLFELIKLFLISERDTYYGYFLMNMSVAVDFERSMIAGIRLNEDPPVFACNPLILCKMNLKEIVYVICHEIEHVLLDHPALMVKTCKNEPEEALYEFNLAADASVNDRLDAEILQMDETFMSAPEGVVNSDALAKMLELKTIKHLENYAYYYDLIQKQKRKGKDLPNESNGSSQQAEAIADALSSKEAEDGDDGDATPDETKQYNVASSSMRGQMQDHQWGLDDEEEAHVAARNLVNSVVDAMDEETRGKMPASFMSEVKHINTPPMVNWEKVLKRYVGTISAGKRKTKTRLNRRQPNRFDLSGSVSDKILKIAICLDTSGSVSDEMLSEIINEVFAILAKRKKEITIIECDSAVQRVYTISNPKDIQSKVHGRGGTAFTPAIEHLNSNKRFRDALMIYFTDGFGELEIPKPLVYRALWVVYNDKDNLSLKNPYGDVVAMKRGQ